ncbi:hypothetical protein JTB14_003704 [Gonioctena quinquepunctata]|nr:hypothetical protein JTB14_003704 [Gonioctena quinquepunctata]
MALSEMKMLRISIETIRKDMISDLLENEQSQKQAKHNGVKQIVMENEIISKELNTIENIANTDEIKEKVSKSRNHRNMNRKNKKKHI